MVSVPSPFDVLRGVEQPLSALTALPEGLARLAEAAESLARAATRSDELVSRGVGLLDRAEAVAVRLSEAVDPALERLAALPPRALADVVDVLPRLPVVLARADRVLAALEPAADDLAPTVRTALPTLEVLDTMARGLIRLNQDVDEARPVLRLRAAQLDAGIAEAQRRLGDVDRVADRLEALLRAGETVAPLADRLEPLVAAGETVAPLADRLEPLVAAGETLALLADRLEPLVTAGETVAPLADRVEPLVAAGQAVAPQAERLGPLLDAVEPLLGDVDRLRALLDRLEPLLPALERLAPLAGRVDAERLGHVVAGLPDVVARLEQRVLSEEGTVGDARILRVDLHHVREQLDQLLPGLERTTKIVEGLPGAGIAARRAEDD